MVLNWTPEVIVDFIVGTMVFIAAIYSFSKSRIKKLKSLLFLRIGVFLVSIFFFTDGLVILFINPILSRIEAFIVFIAFLLIIIGVQYIVAETYKSITIIVMCCLGVLLLYLAFMPNSVAIRSEFGYTNVSWVGLFTIFGDLVLVIGGIVLFYWGLKTYLGAPLLIKKEAFIFLIGITISNPVTLIVYMLYYVFPIFIIISDLMAGLGMIIFIYIVVKEPKLLYILPFTVYRILVKNKQGYPLYDHNWTETSIDENLFTGFLNAVQVMSEEVMNIGGLLDINLEKGILIVNESKSITVGLVASKSSKLLRECVLQFTIDFEKKFEKELKKSVKEISQYESAFELIEKYFSNFPYKIVKSKKEPLLLTGKYLKIPLELEDKLRKIFPDPEEFESIKTELIKSPFSFYSEFLNLHDNLKKEMKLTSENETKLLDEHEKEENE